MGRRSYSSSFCGMLKACFGRGTDDEYWEESVNGRRMFASDEDRGRWVGDPRIDSKASAFIARFYATRVSDSESQFAS